MKPTTDFALLVPMFWDNLNNNVKNPNFSSITNSSIPLNVQLFVSLHIVHIKQRGVAFNTNELPFFPYKLNYLLIFSIVNI